MPARTDGSLRIEDYALLSDTHSAALVGNNGSIDWLTFPRFDSPACFAALLGGPEHGRWLVAPRGGVRHVRRHYLPATMVLETLFECDTGTVAVIDCMPIRNRVLDLVRLVECRSGTVEMQTELIVRMDYGSIVPWVRATDDGLLFVAGPDALLLRTPIELRGENWTHVGRFTVSAGQRVPFHLGWHPSHLAPGAPVDAAQAVDGTVAWWRDWAARTGPEKPGPYEDAVQRSLLTLKALTYAPTGGIVAAPTTSLPESLGGVRNWDYRLCWLRDATFCLLSLLRSGHVDEAKAWRDWLLRAVAGKPEQAQIMYGPAGERRLTEQTLDWLPGYEGSKPVRSGNAAHAQFQLDVYGEVLDALFQGQVHGIRHRPEIWPLEVALTEVVERRWQEPDDGLWEMRSGRRHFTHSKVMAWVALDRAIRSVERFRLPAAVERWRGVRDAIRADVLANGVDDRGVFVQSYGSHRLDASLLTIPLVGFLPADDPRVVATTEAIQRELSSDGFVRRYDPGDSDDGLPGSEGSFLMCTFWLADSLALMGRRAEAIVVFERLLAIRNDVGLLAEQYDPAAGRQLGNFPQAFSHVALIDTAANLSDPSANRRGG